jgi:hypothetical protein
MSSHAPASGAITPDKNKIKTTCTSNNPCVTFTNKGEGPGVQGVSQGEAYNHETGAVQAYATGSYGLNGLFAYASDNSGAWIVNDTDSYYNLFAQATTSGGYPFAAVNSANGTEFYVDPEGDGSFTGTVYAAGFETDAATRGGRHVGTFTSASTRATLEDTGSSRLSGGEAAVRFAPAFARTIDASRGYQVFLTPGGDTRGLYVASKYEGGFIVRESEHGRSSIPFDYRVVAHPYGASDAMLPELPNRMRPATGTFANRAPRR